MEHLAVSVWMAKLLGIYLLVVGCAVLFNQNHYLSLGRKFTEHPILLYLTGWIDFSFGLLIVLFHPYLGLDWTTLITFIGALLIFRGGIRLLFPRFVLQSARRLQRWYQPLLRCAGVFSVVVGLLLLFFAISQ